MTLIAVESEHVKMGDRLVYGVVIGYRRDGSGAGRRDRVTLVALDDRHRQHEIEYEVTDMVMVERSP